MNLILTPRLAGTSKIILSRGFIVKAEGERAFTDSEWVVVTDITFRQPAAIITRLKEWLKSKIKLPDDSKPS